MNMLGESYCINHIYIGRTFERFSTHPFISINNAEITYNYCIRGHSSAAVVDIKQPSRCIAIFFNNYDNYFVVKSYLVASKVFAHKYSIMDHIIQKYI